MAHLPPYPDTGDDAGMGSDRESTTSRPRWMSVVGIIVVIALLVLFVVLHLTGTIGPNEH